MYKIALGRTQMAVNGYINLTQPQLHIQGITVQEKQSQETRIRGSKIMTEDELIIGGLQPISRDTDNNGKSVVYICWWTNKRS